MILKGDSINVISFACDGDSVFQEIAGLRGVRGGVFEGGGSAAATTFSALPRASRAVFHPSVT